MSGTILFPKLPGGLRSSILILSLAATGGVVLLFMLSRPHWRPESFAIALPAAAMVALPVYSVIGRLRRAPDSGLRAAKASAASYAAIACFGVILLIAGFAAAPLRYPTAKDVRSSSVRAISLQTVAGRRGKTRLKLELSVLSEPAPMEYDCSYGESGWCADPAALEGAADSHRPARADYVVIDGKLVMLAINGAPMVTLEVEKNRQWGRAELSLLLGAAALLYGGLGGASWTKAALETK